MTFVIHQEQCRLKWKESVLECQRLKSDIDLCNEKLQDYEKKLNRARCLLDAEKKKRLKAESERDELVN